MITDQIKELAAAKAKLAELESTVAAGLQQELAALPATYGFDTVAAFLAAVRAASGKRRGRKPGSAKSPVKVVGKRKRAKITDATRDAVKKLVAAGKTGAEIAKAVGISLPSVQNVKKALGLVGEKKKSQRLRIRRHEGSRERMSAKIG